MKHGHHSGQKLLVYTILVYSRNIQQFGYEVRDVDSYRTTACTVTATGGD